MQIKRAGSLQLNGQPRVSVLLRSLRITLLIFFSLMLLLNAAGNTFAEEQQPIEEPPSAEEPPAEETPQPPQASLPAEEPTDKISDFIVNSIQVSPAGNSGTAATAIPISVPPGRKGVEPRISLNYNSGGGNGWIGAGWGLDMGAIQRSTKRGVCYLCNDYVAAVNGSSVELVPRGDWGSNYYGAKTEGAFSKYYKYPNGGWIVTAKDGTKYYYGKSPASKQERDGFGAFNWYLDRVEDTNGNYMTVSYTEDQGQKYLYEIKYTGNSVTGLGTSNYVKFHLEDRADSTIMYTTNFSVKTAKRLKTIEVGTTNGGLVRKYELEYQYSPVTKRSVLGRVTQFGIDAVTALPAIEFTYQQGGSSDGGSVAFTQTSRSTADYRVTSDFKAGDIDGDGDTDLVYIKGAVFEAWYSNGNGSFTVSPYQPQAYPPGSDGVDFQYAKNYITGDFNGDGKTDLIQIHYQNGKAYVWLSTNGEHSIITFNPYGQSYSLGQASDFLTGDIDGDGKTDLVRIANNIFYFWFSNGDGTFTITQYSPWQGYDSQQASKYKTGDFNGDGKTDMMHIVNNDTCYVWLSAGRSAPQIINFLPWPGYALNEAIYYVAGDIDGDGDTDLVHINESVFNVWFSNGDGTFNVEWHPGVNNDAYDYKAGDFNGDGKSDMVYIDRNSGHADMWLSKGKEADITHVSESLFWGVSSAYYLTGDFNGDGKTDFFKFRSWSGGNDAYTFLSTTERLTGPIPDTLIALSNGIGAATTLSYLPSSFYDNYYLPFIVQTLESVSVNDGNGSTSTTTYDYSGGYYDITDREYRGFEYVKATAPNNTTTETWFKQDDIFKGPPDTQVTRGSSGNLYTAYENIYDSVSPYTGVDFPRLRTRYDSVYDGTATPKTAATDFYYDDYGNLTGKYYHGDLAVTGDESNDYFEYFYNTSSWIVSLPKTIARGDGVNSVAAQWMTYDSKGNLLTKTSWLNGGTYPVTTYTYDSYGNVATIKDAKNYLSTISYDSTYTYPVQMTNPLGQTVRKTYDYRFGKVSTETDPNNNVTRYEYNQLGLLTKVTNQNDYDAGSTYGTISYYYENIGTVGSQRVLTRATEQSGTANYIWSAAYFDGLGRTIKTAVEGPDNKVIAARKVYDYRGLLTYESLPYFDSVQTDYGIHYEYDPVGRVTVITYPYSKYATKSYLKGRTTVIDANGHQKVEEKDVYGRTTKIEEYTGVNPSFSLYSTTTYQYDPLGNLTRVTDGNGNQTNMTYDTLSRKTSMTDPDMGYWTYQYDANGNLVYQTDAKSQTITFSYDYLNRIRYKVHPDASYIAYIYDEAFAGNGKGRLTTVSNINAQLAVTSSTKYYYDKLGRTTKTIKTIDSTAYTTETAYDALGRTFAITYPDATLIKYEYDTGGNLIRVKDNSTGFVYASYTGYTAAGQIGRTDFGNGVNTIYQYYAQNKRLFSITTSMQTTYFMNISYNYDNVGNISGITDYLDSTKNRTYGYDALNRLTSANSQSYGGNILYEYDRIGNMTYNCKYGNYYYDDNAHKHAVTRVVNNGVTTNYTYDANGNMISGGGRTFTYDYDNRPTSIVYNNSAVISVYDESGQRVKKVTPSSSTVYIGDIYECKNGVCAKYIFAGSQRIAKLESANPYYAYYYHTDHLGSSSIMTNSSGNKVEDIFYYPYGEIKYNTGTIDVKHKFTGQEWDAETGLYYYGARYYDPKLARFISADTIVPSAFDPQSLNRYSYTRNNPVIYVDPSGHWWWLVGAVIGALSAGSQSDWDVGAMLTGAIIGGVSGGVFSGVEGAVSSAIANSITNTTLAGALSGAAGGMAAGATAGGLGAAIYGGDIGQGILRGAGFGAIGGGAFGAIGGHYGSTWSLDRAFVSGLAGGGVSELAGGKFGEGFMYAAVPVAARSLYNKWVNYDVTFESGGDVVKKGYTTPPIKGANNIGTQGEALNHNGWFNEGGRVSRFANRIPGINAVGGLHDVFQVNLDIHLGNFARNVFNVPGMLPATAITYSALVTDYSAVVNYQTVIMRDERR